MCMCIEFVVQVLKQECAHIFSCWDGMRPNRVQHENLRESTDPCLQPVCGKECKRKFMNVASLASLLAPLLAQSPTY